MITCNNMLGCLNDRICPLFYFVILLAPIVLILRFGVRRKQIYHKYINNIIYINIYHIYKKIYKFDCPVSIK